MGKFTKEEIEIIEEDFACYGFESAVTDQMTAWEILSKDEDINSLIMDVVQAEQEYYHKLRMLKESLKKEGIETYF